MIPRHNILTYLDEYGDATTVEQTQLVFDRINSSVRVFVLVLNDLQKMNLANIENLNQTPIEERQYYLPDSLKNLKITLTEIGKDYIHRKLKNIINRNQFTEDPFDTLIIDKGHYYLPHFDKMSFEEFKKTHKHLINDFHLYYFLLTGKITRETKMKIFISYSWGDKKHEKWVSNLAEKLKTEFDVIIDKNDFKAGGNKFEWLCSKVSIVNCLYF